VSDIPNPTTKLTHFSEKEARSSGFLPWPLKAALSVLVLGVAGAGVYNVVTYKCHARQAEAAVALSTLRVVQAEFFQEQGTYSANLSQLGFRPPAGGKNYSYSARTPTPETFVVEARGTGDVDGDVWTLTENGAVKNTVDGCGL
jgi:type II secretory pathway pseudopilin PulG